MFQKFGPKDRATSAIPIGIPGCPELAKHIHREVMNGVSNKVSVALFT